MLAVALVLAVQAPRTIAIENVTVVEPGTTNATKAQTVLIENGLFTQIGPKVKIPKNATRINGKGKFLIPGLWDMHVHWYDESALGLFTANGVTGIRVMWGFPINKEWRKKAEQGKIVGPRVFTAGPIVDGPDPVWQGSIAMKSPDEAAAIVKRHKDEKWDFVKTYSFMSRESYFSIAREAKKQGIPFAGHVPYTVSLLEAAKAGHRSNEHLGGFLLDLWSNGEELRQKIILAAEQPKPKEEIRKILESGDAKEPVDRAKLKALATELAKTGMWQCPTLNVLRSIAHLDQESFTKDPRLKYMAKEMRTMWDPANDFRFKARTKADWEKERENYKVRTSIVKPLLDAGNRFLAGTDCLNPYCFPGFSLHDELDLLVQAGLSPTQALEAATVNPARFFGEDKKWGLIKKGMRADAVLLSADPLTNIRNTKKISAVIQGGRLWDRKALDALLKKNVH